MICMVQGPVLINYDLYGPGSHNLHTITITITIPITLTLTLTVTLTLSVTLNRALTVLLLFTCA